MNERLIAFIRWTVCMYCSFNLYNTAHSSGLSVMLPVQGPWQ